MRIFKSRWLNRFARQQRIADASLRQAIERAEQGLIDADLGGGLIKQRVARSGAGRSGGYRMIVAYKKDKRAVFLYGFAKSERENIEPQELDDFRAVGKRWLDLSAGAIAIEVQQGRLHEVAADDKDEEA